MPLGGGSEDMTNERIANIAVSVTAAMLATAAVAFTLTGNAPQAPGSQDLPVVALGRISSPSSDASATGTPAVVGVDTTTTAGPAHQGAGAVRTSAKPSAASPGSPARPAQPASGPSAGFGSSSGTKSSDDDDDHDDHEVVKPKIHESDEEHDASRTDSSPDHSSDD